jgi:D-glycero-D-manno-heptose 1,7-bisphosphate phosphatase
VLAILDRDGVLNVDRADFVKTPGELVLIDGAAEAVARLNRAGWRVAVATNQSCVGRGLVSPDMLSSIHEVLRGELARKGAHLDELLVCPDAPWQASDRRKPGPGMIREALATFREPPGQAWVIGDALRDLEAAAAAGCRRALVRTGKGAATQAAGIPRHVLPVSIFEDLGEAVRQLLGEAS